jgi:thiopurine S-methyltransferase
MQKEFWAERWQSNRTGFHRAEVNDALVTFAKDCFAEKGRILVPLCGKTMDLDWLMKQGYSVTGVEFVPEAVLALEARWGPPSKKVQHGSFVRRDWGDQCTILQGDIFDLPGAQLPAFDGVWDRAALVALNPTTREQYASVLKGAVGPGGGILLRTFAYDQSKMDGPPFSVERSLVEEKLFGDLTVRVLDQNRS